MHVCIVIIITNNKKILFSTIIVPLISLISGAVIEELLIENIQI